MRYVILLILFFASMNLHAVQINVGEMKTFPVAKPLEFNTGVPVTAIETGVLTDGRGNLARGPHLFEITLEQDAPYPVVIRGQTVQPGETAYFVQNLSRTGHQFNAQIYPAVDGVEGVAKFTLSIPDIWIKACPENFTERESDCYRAQHQVVVYECPDNTELNSVTKQCERLDTVLSQEFCSAPFVIAGGQCVHQFSIPATQNCPTTDGWVNDGNRCVYYDAKPATSCSAGYMFNNGYCYAVKDAQTVCQAGYTLTNGHCELFDSKSLDSCPAGYLLRDGLCFESVPMAEVCPVGYELKSEGICFKIDEVDRLGECPNGYDTFGLQGKCYAQNGSEPTKLCPNGGSVVNNECVENSTIGASANCPSGAWSSGGSCYTEYEYQATKECADWGYELGSDGNCYQRANYEPDPNSCPSGYSYGKWVANRCVDSQAFVISDWRNKTNEQEDAECSAAGGRYASWDGANVVCWYQQITWVSPKYVCNSPNYLTNYASGGTFCTSGTTGRTVYSCDSGHGIRGTTCVATSETWVESYYCPSGYVLNGSTCTRSQTYPVTYQCNTGVLIENACRSEVQPTPQTECPSGYTENAEGICVGASSEPAKTNCNGTTIESNTGMCLGEWNRSLVGWGHSRCGGGPGAGYSAVVAPDECLWTNHDTGDQVQGWYYVDCSVGSWQEGDMEGACYENFQQTYKGTLVCPNNMYLSVDMCYDTSPMLFIGQCPGDGYILNQQSGMCEKELNVSTEFVCDTGYSAYSNTECIADSSSTNVGLCPSQYELNTTNSKCERFDTQPYQYECDSDSTLSGATKCVANTSDLSMGICQSGYVLDVATGVCEDTKTQNINYTCDGYDDSESKELQGVNCQVTYTENFGFKCPAGYESYSLDQNKLSCSGIVKTNAAIQCDTANGFRFVPELGQCFKEEVLPFLQTYNDYQN